MPIPLRVLIVEDLPDDAEMMVLHLTHEGFQPEWRRVQTEADYLAALETNPDLILADWSLPQFSGLRALQLMNARGLDIPFIIVSGSIGEASAVEAMRQRAADYVLKDRLGRLGQAVRNSLENKYLRDERKKAEERIVHLNEVLSAIRNVNQIIVRERDPQKVLQAACGILAQTRTYVLVWVGVADSGSSKVVPVAWNGEASEYLEKVHITWDESATGQGPIGRAMRLRSAQFCQEILNDPTFAPWREQALAHGFASSAAIPILHNEHLFGVLSVYAAQPNVFDEEEAGLLVELAGDLAYALHNIDEEKKRVQAEDELHTLWLYHEALLMAVPEIVAEVDNHRVYRWVNPAGIEFFGEDVVGKEAAGYFIGEQQVYQTVAPLFNGDEETIYVESWQRRKDGGKRLLAWWCRSPKDSQGNVTGALSSARDITESRRIEEALRESEAKYRQLHESMRDAFVSVDMEGNLLEWNGAYQQMLGYSDEELRRLAYFDITPKRWREMEAKLVAEQILPRGYSDTYQKEYRCKNGNMIPVELRTFLLRDSSGNPTGMWAIVRDITERKRAENALRESEDRYRDLVENSQDLICTHDLEGRILSANPWSAKALGYEMDTLLQMNIRNILAPEVRGEFEAYLAEIQQRGAAKGLLLVQTATGERRIWEYNNTLRTENVAVPVVRGMAHDITERKRAEEAVKAYSEKLEQMVEERTRELRETQEQLIRQERLATLGQLAGGVGHELRNPLGVISNAVYYLKLIQPEASDKVRQYHTILEDEVRIAEKIITNLLDFARVQYVDREAIAAPQLAADILQRHPAPPNVTVAQDFDPALPRVYADVDQMIQALGNLLVNAYQAMIDGGQLTLRGVRELRGEETGVAIHVSDTGMGIRPENMGKIFDPLFTTKARGIGMGLAVCKKLVEANNGCIEMHSQPGQGSTFTVWLPVYEKKTES